MNNIANIITLCIKCDFPEKWSTAFEDLLSLGDLGWAGVDLAIRVIADLEIEVVMFSESRSPREIAHNTAIKDAMRSGVILINIVNFLCNSAFSCISQSEVLSVGEAALTALSTMIGWIDISLIVNDSVLPRIYSFLNEEGLASSACTCLLEIAKKGMEPSDKVKLLEQIGLIPTLSGLPFSMTNSDGIEEDVGTAIDVIFLELLGCWGVFETYAVASVQGEGVSGDHAVAIEMGQVSGRLIKLAMPLLLKVFSHAESAVATTTLPSFKKLIVQLKKQWPSQPGDPSLCSSTISDLRQMNREWFFVPSDYLSAILAGIFTQLQYPSTFYEDSADADEDDEDVAAELEVSASSDMHNRDACDRGQP
jgi:hypothetical protein